MTCQAIRDQLLEADLDDLRDGQDTSLARHLRMCDECALIARTIVDTEMAMGTSLDSLARGRSIKVLPVSKTRWLWRVAVPIAVAAGLVAVLVRGGSMPMTTTQATSMVDHVPIVESSGSKNFTVFNTNDPDIVVVWFFGGAD